eukprot:TRINITY_DN6604_c0_g1_i2.p2 TRINITY_DN6604_c0_g1~~TRINITY_DN6604_c0_g1_i2.p2  ORF type:complete len:168 (+),score=20.81 TRINITY_DN6604_c0_g1_i2:103-606(+)
MEGEQKCVAGETFSHAVSLGSLCVTASWLQGQGLRTGSGPFDWVHSSPTMVVQTRRRAANLDRSKRRLRQKLRNRHNPKLQEQLQPTCPWQMQSPWSQQLWRRPSRPPVRARALEAQLRDLKLREKNRLNELVWQLSLGPESVELQESKSKPSRCRRRSDRTRRGRC